MHLSVLAAFTVALAMAVALPGPGIFAVVSCAIARGRRAALAMVAGIALGDLVYFACAVLGMAALARSMGEIFLVVKLAGAGYLMWLGVQLWRTRPVARAALAADEVSPPSPTRDEQRRNFLGGFLVTLGNPKAIAFYAGLLPTFVNLETLSAAEAGVMGGIVVVTVAGIMGSYAALAAGSRDFFARPARLRGLNRAAGTLLIGSGFLVASR